MERVFGGPHGDIETSDEPEPQALVFTIYAYAATPPATHSDRYQRAILLGELAASSEDVTVAVTALAPVQLPGLNVEADPEQLTSIAVWAANALYDTAAAAGRSVQSGWRDGRGIELPRVTPAASIIPLED